MPTMAPTALRTIAEVANTGGVTVGTLAVQAGLGPALNDETAIYTVMGTLRPKYLPCCYDDFSAMRSLCFRVEIQ